MPILSGDIKLVASQVMDDVPEGGGAPTSTVILDGASNAIFPDISELDRAGGKVNLRKMHVSVQTGDTDTYMGVNIIVADPPTDPNVSITLFSTKETFDRREDARKRLESYLIAGPEWAGFLLEDHVIGQRKIQIFQRELEPPPNVGETLVLVYDEGLPTEQKQFVRATDTSVTGRTYTVMGSNGRTYRASVVAVDLSDALRYDFPGSTQNEYFARDATKTRIRSTSVADAAEYCGAAKLMEPLGIGDMTARAESIFTQLVPSSQTEVPLVDYTAAGASTALTPASDGTVSYTTAQPFDAATVLSVGNSITPGTLGIALSSGGTLTDAGGQLYAGATVVGAVDYARGQVAFPGLATPYTGSKTITFSPAAAPLRVANTAQIPVTQESRSYNYITTVVPTPAAGSGQVSYRSQGRWYDLRDDGSGILRGTDPTYGAGTINYATGTFAVTLGALPDVGSAVMLAWNTKVNYINRSAMAVDAPQLRIQAPEGDIVPGTVTVTWNDGTPRTATDNGKGLITGDAVGHVNYKLGRLSLTPSTLPMGGQAFTVIAAFGVANVLTHSAIDPPRSPDSTITISLGHTNITPGTVLMSWPVELISAVDIEAIGIGNLATHYYIPGTRYAYDDGNGLMFPSPGDYRPMTSVGASLGTINYAAGTVTFQPDGMVVARKDVEQHYPADQYRYATSA